MIHCMEQQCLTLIRAAHKSNKSSITIWLDGRKLTVEVDTP